MKERKNKVGKVLRKIKGILILVHLGFFVSSALFSQDVDVLQNFNGDFEEGIAFWRFFEVPDNIGSAWEITSDAVSGDKAMKLIWVASNGSVNDRGFDNWSAAVPVIAGTDYSVKALMKSDETSDLLVTFTVGFFDFNGGVISQVNNNYALTTAYTEHGFTVTAPGNAAFCWIAFRMFDTNNQRVAGTMYLDNVRLFGSSVTLAPRVMATTLPVDDVPVASINVMDEPYNAKNDGSADATSAFQDAINRALIAGGAVVFVPAGYYRFDGHLNVPSRVVLRGEWENPDSVGGVIGSILMAYGDKGSEEGAPFIMVQNGAGIRNLSIWYPEQDAPSVTPFPWTIHCLGINTSIVNVNLVNSYNGIKIGPDWNALHYIRNVFGTPLKQGIWLSQTTDIGRIENVHFEPKYWSGSGLSGSPTENNILNWLQNNNATGIVMGRSDWEYIYDVSFVGYQTGLQLIKYTDHGPNGVIYGLRIEKSNVGIDLVEINSIGWAISNAIINVEGVNSACVRAGDAFNSVVQFNTCSFGGDPKTVIKFSGNSTGRLSFQNCTFENWGQTENTPAIDCTRGSVSLLGNTFNLDKLHLRLGPNASNAQILDNNFPVELNIDNESNGEVLISQEPMDFAKQNVPAHPYALVPHPTSNDLYSVLDFGAVADGLTDNTIAFQTALDSASQNGGGTVYIPAGRYRLDSHIVVPTGVELRGIWDIPHHTSARGCVIFAYEGKGDPDGTPFISLEPGSGVRGFTVWYPEQSTGSFFPYPWSIRTLGEDCWIKDVSFGSTYQCVDLASYPSAGHVVSYLGASPLKTGISVSKNTGDGWIENIQLNPHYWAHTSGYPQPEIPDINVIIAKQQDQLDAFKIASATHEHILGTFVYAAKRGMYLAPDDGASNIDIFLHGTDAGSNAVYLESKAGSKINFVNTQLVLLGTTQEGIITSSPGFGADASFFNSISWGGAGPTTNIKGDGNILIQQLHTHNGTLKLNSGTVRLENIAISTSLNPQYIIGSGIGELKLFGSYSGNGFIMYNYNSDRSIVETDYFYYNRNSEEAALATGWENGDKQNTWDNIFFGHKDFVIEDNLAFQCESVVTDEAHTGSRALQVAGSKIDGATPMYKIFNSKIPVSEFSSFSYWLKPQDESGKSGHVDFLFTDGTRLTELSAVADDGLALDAARGTIGEWTEINCSIGNYAHGKTIQSVLVGTELDTVEQFDFLIDDLNVNGAVSVKSVFADPGLALYQNYPNPFEQYTTIPFYLKKGGVVRLTVYDMVGKEISLLLDDQPMNAGSYEFKWVPDNIKEGTYFYKLEFLSDFDKRSYVSRKMIFVK